MFVLASLATLEDLTQQVITPYQGGALTDWATILYVCFSEFSNSRRLDPTGYHTLSGWCSNRLSYIPLFWFYRLSFVFIKFATHDKVPTLEPPVRVGVRVALARFAREVLWCSKTLRATIHRASKQNWY